MKKVVFLTILSVMSIFALSTYFSACTPDACKTRAVECRNSGTCLDGNCICAKGYEGDSCQFRVNEKFNSYYACIRTELINGTGINDNDDTIRVKANNDRFSIEIYSIRDSLYEVINAKVDGNSITIPEQNHEFPMSIPATVYKYSGSGSLNSGVLTVTLYKTLISQTTTWSSKTTYVGYKYE